MPQSLLGWAQPIGPLTLINVSEYAGRTFIIITGTRKLQESFSSADSTESCAVTLLLLVLPGL